MENNQLKLLRSRDFPGPAQLIYVLLLGGSYSVHAKTPGFVYRRREVFPFFWIRLFHAR